VTTTAYSAGETAVLIVDPYNDFMSKGGKLYEAIREAVGEETWGKPGDRKPGDRKPGDRRNVNRFLRLELGVRPVCAQVSFPRFLSRRLYLIRAAAIRINFLVELDPHCKYGEPRKS
jgi:hypothetical protein